MTIEYDALLFYIDMLKNDINSLYTDKLYGCICIPKTLYTQKMQCTMSVKFDFNFIFKFLDVFICKLSVILFQEVLSVYDCS